MTYWSGIIHSCPSVNKKNTEGWATRPFEIARVGHPEKLNQFLGDNVLEWYNSLVPVCQEECERVGHPPVLGGKIRGVPDVGGLPNPPSASQRIAFATC